MATYPVLALLGVMLLDVPIRSFADMPAVGRPAGSIVVAANDLPPPDGGNNTTASGSHSSPVVILQTHCEADQAKAAGLQDEIRQAQAALASPCNGASSIQCETQGVGFRTQIVSATNQLSVIAKKEQTDCPLPAPPPSPAPDVSLTVSDVSPDMAFGASISQARANSGGRTYSLVIDPNNNSLLYAASEGAGIWKSTDSGHSWNQSSAGLLNGYVPFSHHILAIDANESQKLLFASNSDDGSPSYANGGLYVSTDSAGHWRHVALTTSGANPCVGQTISSVAFSSGQAFVMTSCALFTNADAGLADSKWTAIANPPFSPAGAVLAQNSFGSAVFECNGSSVYASYNLGGSWTQLGNLGSGTSCLDVTVAPIAQQTSPTTVAVVYGVAKSATYPNGGQEVAIVGPSGAGPALGFSTVSSKDDGSGVSGVFAARKASAPSSDNSPGSGFDLYASDGLYFYLLSGQGSWNQLQHVHADTWSMAFPNGYDPANGSCGAYATMDGGVVWNSSSQALSSGGCDATGGWVAAMSGLHTLETYVLEGVSQTQYDPTCSWSCATVYLANGDNDVWAIWNGGLKSGVLDDYLGDAGDVHIDPAYPKQAFLTRGLCAAVAVSATSGPPAPGAQILTGSGCGANGVAPANFTTGPCSGGFPSLNSGGVLGPCPLGPGNPTLTQVKALASEQVTTPVYYAVASQSGQPDSIVVSTSNPPTAASWSPVETGLAIGFFPTGTVMQLRSSGGVTHRVLWVLAINAQGKGQVYKGIVSANGLVSQWLPASSPGVLTNAADLFVNPYDPNSNYAWVTDVGVSKIVSTHDGGQTWQPAPTLTKIATNNGAFRFGCHELFFDYACALSSMSFSRTHPNIAVAALYPGGLAYSNTSGQTWANLIGVTNGPTVAPTPSPVGNLPGYPIAVWYDDSAFSAPSIYAAFHWNRTVRIDGQFDQLPEQ